MQISHAGADSNLFRLGGDSGERGPELGAFSLNAQMNRVVSKEYVIKIVLIRQNALAYNLAYVSLRNP